MKYKKGDVLRIKDGRKVRLMIEDVGSPEMVTERCYPNEPEWVTYKTREMKAEGITSVYLLKILEGHSELDVPAGRYHHGPIKLVDEEFVYDSDYYINRMMDGGG